LAVVTRSNAAAERDAKTPRGPAGRGGRWRAAASAPTQTGPVRGRGSPFRAGTSAGRRRKSSSLRYRIGRRENEPARTERAGDRRRQPDRVAAPGAARRQREEADNGDGAGS